MVKLCPMPKKQTAKQKAATRVLLAKDILSYVSKKILHPTHSVFVRRTNQRYGDSLFRGGVTGQREGLLTRGAELPVKCNVCADGALAYAAIMRFNDRRINKDEHPTEWEGVVATLSRWFSESQLGLIEAAFEGIGIRGTANERDTKALARATTWYHIFHVSQEGVNFNQKRWRADCDKLMVAIFRNIIKNKGTFKP